MTRRDRPGGPVPAPRRGGSDGPGLSQVGRLFGSLSPDWAKAFRPYAGTIARAIRQEIQSAVPEYAKPMEGTFGDIFRTATERAVLHCVDCIGNPAATQDDSLAVFRHLGTVEFAEGRSLDSLQTAYRVGGRVAWRAIAEIGERYGADADTMCIAAEAIFAYVDEMSGLSIEGYTRARARAAGRQARRRKRLLELIVADPPASPQAIVELAAETSWKLPEYVTVVAVEPNRAAVPGLPEQVLVDFESQRPHLLVPRGVCEVTELAEALRGRPAAAGPEVRLPEASISAKWAHRCLELRRRGLVSGDGMLRVTDHLSTLWLLADEYLIKQLGRQCLRPFDELTAKQRKILGETLLSWLQTRGGAPEIADRLGCHPQTIRRRLRRIEELFGDRLQDANQRLTLTIALRAQVLLAPPATRG